jgi:hypothetical protein
VAHVVITVEEEKFKADMGAVTKVGVISSNEVYHTGSPRGEHKAKGTKHTWRQLGM